MISFRRPTADAIQEFQNAQAEFDFSYPAVGATVGTPPAGYVVDHTRQKLGQGADVFHIAKTALENWQHFELGWVEAHYPAMPIRQGEVVAVAAHVACLWWLNACRIVYIVDETSPRRSGFAYGTLPGHAESGEERFVVEMDDAGDVWYDILAFSRPRHPLARLGYPLTRLMQKHFARDSAAAMLLAVEQIGHRS